MLQYVLKTCNAGMMNKMRYEPERLQRYQKLQLIPVNRFSRKTQGNDCISYSKMYGKGIRKGLVTPTIRQRIFFLFLCLLVHVTMATTTIGCNSLACQPLLPVPGRRGWWARLRVQTPFS